MSLNGHQKFEIKRKLCTWKCYPVYEISIFQAKNTTFWKRILGNVTQILAFTGVRRSWQPYKDNHEHYHHQLFVSFTSIHLHDRILRQKFQSFACAMQRLTTPSNHTDIQSAMSTDDAMNSRIKWKLSQVLLFKNTKKSEACYSIGRAALDWSVTFYKFANVDRILIADSTIDYSLTGTCLHNH